MIRGIGLDLCEIARIRKACALTAFLENVFTEEERRYAGDAAKPVYHAHLAAAFAAKEAFAKAVGTGFSSFQPSDVEVVHSASGAPRLILHGKAAEALAAAGGRETFVTLTHEKETAAAAVIIEG